MNICSFHIVHSARDPHYSNIHSSINTTIHKHTITQQCNATQRTISYPTPPHHTIKYHDMTSFEYKHLNACILISIHVSIQCLHAWMDAYIYCMHIPCNNSMHFARHRLRRGQHYESSSNKGREEGGREHSMDNTRWKAIGGCMWRGCVDGVRVARNESEWIHILLLKPVFHLQDLSEVGSLKRGRGRLWYVWGMYTWLEATIIGLWSPQ